MNLFGRKKVKAAPKLSDSIQGLRSALEILDKQEKHFSKQIQEAESQAKVRARAKDKRGALAFLKRKKLYEKRVDQIYGKKSNLEVQIMALESAASNKEVFNVMKQGKVALAAAVSENDVDNVGEFMDDLSESLALNEEMGEAMAQPIGQQVDDDELLAELDDMQNELDELDVADAEAQKDAARLQAEATAAALSEPGAAVPTRPIGGGAQPTTTKEDDELRELEALME